MKIFENIINHKINTITAEELLKYANNLIFTLQSARKPKIAEYLRGKKVNIFNDARTCKLIKEIAKIAGA